MVTTSTMPRMNWMRRRGAGLVAPVLAALAGCAGTSERRSDASGRAQWDEIAAAAARLDDALKRVPPEHQAPLAARPSPLLPEPGSQEPEAPALLVGPDPASALVVAGAPPAEPQTPAPHALETPEVADAAASMAGEDRPLADALRLALSEALGDRDAAGRLSMLEPSLTPAQRTRLEAFRALIAELVRDDDLTPDALVATLLDRARALEPARPLSIPTATLARRVTGFGRFVPFESSRFLAGKAHAALVYVEVADFAHRPAVSSSPIGFRHLDAPEPASEGAAEYVIELTQELRLYHRADGVLAWMSREQPSRDVSRRKRTDHYLVQRISLPATLTVGGYSLKVLLRDTTTGATAEAIIPIEMVADESLTRADLP